jgi:hypothetical protein
VFRDICTIHSTLVSESLYLILVQIFQYLIYYTSEKQKQIERRFLDLTRKTSDEMGEKSVVQTSLEDDDLEYIHEILGEVRKTREENTTER